jgi:predicted enzyme related to lactoylglutathione lyase
VHLAIYRIPLSACLARVSSWGLLVAKLADARERATRLGGKVLVEEITVPKMGAIGVIQDNVGAAIGLFEARM